MLKGMLYAGIGSRETPGDILALMTRIAQALAECGALLRSGAAPGADQAFEAGCDAASGAKEIFIPWRKFSDNPTHIVDVPAAAMDLAAQYHPAWDRLSQGAKKLMARNMCQILGPRLDAPVHRVICWTKDGGPTGGTGQAIRLAMAHNIPVRNLQRTADRDAMEAWLASLK